MIVLNQLIGPVFFKRVLIWVKEAWLPAKKSDPDQIPLAVVFGSSAQAVALARQLTAHDWQVRIVDRQEKYKPGGFLSDQNFLPYRGISKVDLESYQLDNAGAAVMMMNDPPPLLAEDRPR